MRGGGGSVLIRVGLARARSAAREGSAPYGAAVAPWEPVGPYPEWPGAGAGAASNRAFAAVRAALAALGLDAARFDTPAWNPLGDLVRPGGRVVLKPNFIRHWNPADGAGGSLASVITHGAVVRAMADYAALAVGPEGSVVIAEAPQMDCDFAGIRRAAGLDEIAARHAEQFGRPLEVIDLRREAVRFEDGIMAERQALPGDPRGYRAVDLGAHSFFASSGLDPARFRGADYDPGPTIEQHRGGRHAYLLSETVLQADLVVNLPKLKTHKKTGITLALKNLVGINGDKNWLPHHSLGSPADGGDEFPENRWIDRWRSRATEVARPWLARGRGVALFRAFRSLEDAARGDAFPRAGNWWGNQTTWRMCLDLNRAFYYSDAAGLHLDAEAPVRRVLHVADALLAGEGEGPLAPRDVPLGVVLAALDPVALDLAALQLMGFDPAAVPKVREAMADAGPRVTAVRSPADVRVCEIDAEGGTMRERSLGELRCERPFAPHSGWRGHIEARSEKESAA